MVLAVLLVFVLGRAGHAGECGCGDVNGDASINDLDAIELEAILAGGSDIGAACCGLGAQYCADLAYDGSIGVSDLIALQQCIVEGGLCNCQSDCGNGVLEAPEFCDAGVDNGAADSCCAGDCSYATAGLECRAAVDLCDVAETCNGISATCPVDGYQMPPAPDGKCKPSVVLSSGDPGSISGDFASVLEGNAANILEYFSGGYTFPRKGSAVLTKFGGGPAKLAALITNDAVGSTLDIVWRGKFYHAAPGEQVIAVVPVKKRAKIKLKSLDVATGTVELAVFSDDPFTFEVTGEPRPLMYNQRTKPAKTVFSYTDLGGLSGLGILRCTGRFYGVPQCTEAANLASGFSNESVAVTVESGESLHLVATSNEPGGPISAGAAEIQFSERAGISFATRGSVE